MNSTILRDFLRFLKQPVEPEPRNTPLRQKFVELGAMLLLYLGLMLIVSIPIMIIDAAGWVNMDNHALSGMMHKYPLGVIVLFGAVLIPFIEELIFRLHLRYNRNYGLRALVGLWSGMSGKPKEKVTASVKSWWNRRYGVVFYLTAFIFGLAHVTNFMDDSLIFWLLVPFLTAPQFVGGLLIGFLRLRNGFYWGFLLHAANNFIFILAPLLFFSNEILFHETNDRYELKIEELSPYLPASFSYTPLDNGMEAKAYRLDLAVAYALKQPTYRFTIPDGLSPSKKLNIHLECYHPELNCKQLFREALQQTFHFNVDSALKQVTVFELQIENTDSLAGHRHADPDYPGNKITELGNQLLMENFSVKACADLLSGKYKVPFQYHGSDTSRYYFSLPLGNIESLRETLQSKYGISTHEKEEELMFYELVRE